MFHGPSSITRHERLSLIYVTAMLLCGPRGKVVPGWKLGVTTNLPWRMRIMQNAGRGDATLVALAVGDRAREQAFHRQLSEYRYDESIYVHASEWYRACPEFDAWLARFPAVWRGAVRCSHDDAGEMWWRSTGIVDALASRLAAELGVTPP